MWMDAELWLPRNVSWDRIPSHSEDLVYPIYLALPILLIRICYESFVGVPLRWLFGNRELPLSKQVQDHLLFGFAANTRSKRVLECLFRFTFYLVLWIYGVFVLWDAPWLSDVKQCWIGYPHHPISDSIWWYYMVETGFYYSLLVASIFDVRRTDFLQLVFHHFVTIGLLSASWAINFVRVGTLILLSHDVSDVTLEFAKLVRYNISNSKYSNVCFVVFVASWILTRIGYFPFVVLRSALFQAPDLIQPDYNLFNVFQIPYVPRLIILLLFFLLLLHIFWTLIILRIVFRTIKVGEATDVRSDDEEESDSETNDKPKTTNHHKLKKRKQN